MEEQKTGKYPKSILHQIVILPN